MVDDPRTTDELKARQSSFLAKMATIPGRETMASYENRFVALLDILGFRAALSDFAERAISCDRRLAPVSRSIDRTHMRFSAL